MDMGKIVGGSGMGIGDQESSWIMLSLTDLLYIQGEMWQRQLDG